MFKNIVEYNTKYYIESERAYISTLNLVGTINKKIKANQDEASNNISYPKVSIDKNINDIPKIYGY